MWLAACPDQQNTHVLWTQEKKKDNSKKIPSQNYHVSAWFINYFAVNHNRCELQPQKSFQFSF